MDCHVANAPRNDLETLAAALHSARTALAPVAGELAALEARLLAQHAFGMAQEELMMDSHRVLNTREIEAFHALIARRLQHEPVDHMVGYKEFWKSRFRVSKAVLTPRPDSETIIETVLRLRPDTAQPYRILDLGTGSGCLLLSLLQEYKNATGLGLDYSADALAIAAENTINLGLSTRVELRESNWCSALLPEERFDIIVTNPPYIPAADIPLLDAEVRLYDPMLALDGGKDGLDSTRLILSQLKHHDARGALVACETGKGQASMVVSIAKADGYAVVTVAKDLAGIERVVVIDRQP